jgi:uncharacterized OsmC-like protein
MTSDELRAKQAPLKAQFKDNPASAQATLRVIGTLDTDQVACRIESQGHTIAAGLHPLGGGDGSWACSGDMLLESLAACAGVTLNAVATAMGIPLRGGRVIAEGDLDFRGTLGTSKETPVGFQNIRLRFELDTDATAEQKATLLKLAERYCVIFQTLKQPPTITAEFK